MNNCRGEKFFYYRVLHWTFFRYFFFYLGRWAYILNESYLQKWILDRCFCPPNPIQIVSHNFNVWWFVSWSFKIPKRYHINRADCTSYELEQRLSQSERNFITFIFFGLFWFLQQLFLWFYTSHRVVFIYFNTWQGAKATSITFLVRSSLSCFSWGEETLVVCPSLLILNLVLTYVAVCIWICRDNVLV